MFVTTIAVQLARLQLPCRRVLRAAICEAVREQPDIAQHALIDQWKRLVLQPCQRMRAEAGAAPDAPPCAPPIVIVVDALDECHSADEIEFVLALLSQTSGLAVAELRILLTSRPEIPIREGLLDIPEGARRHLVLHHIDSSVVGKDIRIFLERSLARVTRHGPLLPGVPDDMVLQQLEQRAGGLFVWAATACRFIDEGGPNARKRLDSILQRQLWSSGIHPELKLDEMYTSVLRNAVPDTVVDDERESFCSLLRTVLEAITVSFSSLSMTSLASLLSLPDHEVENSLRNLHSIIDVPDSRHELIRLHHASVRDFLLDTRRCSDMYFKVDEPEAHTHFAFQCLRFMNDKLRQNICRLRGPGVRTTTISQELIDERVPLSLRYACLYWVQHIQYSRNLQTLRDSVDSFMRVHFLHWLEVLGVIGRMTEAVEMVALLDTLYVRGSREGKSSEVAISIRQWLKLDSRSRLARMIADAKRFIIGHRHMIEEAPLQAYASALVFAPTKSIIRQTYSYEVPQWLTQLPKMPNDWSQEWFSLEGHYDVVDAVAFSPDNRLLASGSRDKTVRLWDITTGAARGTLEGHIGQVIAVQFSPDGQLLASASSDKTVRLWRAKTGAASGVLEGHSDNLLSLAFSPDGLFLASASADSTIRLWSTESGAARGVLAGHTGVVMCLTFLPDGRFLASAARNGTVVFWNMMTMSVDRIVRLGAAQGWRDPSSNARPCGMAFSSNGKLLAVQFKTSVKLCDTTTGAVISSFPDKYTASFAFSPNGQFLVSAVGYVGVTLRNVRQIEGYSILTRHDAYVVTFSPDGKFIAVGLPDNTIRLLNVNLGAARAPCDYVPSPINSLIFSADGSLLASKSDGGTVDIWDTKTSAAYPTWKSTYKNYFIHRGVPVIFSPDGTLLAFPLPTGGLMLSNVHAEAASIQMMGHSSEISDVAFSLDGKIIATASYDNTVRLWIVSTGAQWHTLYGHSHWVTTVAFAPDGDILASGSADKTVRLWQVDRGAVCGILQGHSGGIACVSFSPDGSLVGSASHDDVRIWNPGTCEQLYRIRDCPVMRWLKFSANGQTLTKNRSAYRLPPLLSSAPAAAASPDTSYALAVINQWLTCDLENLLWIPRHYRTPVVATLDEAVALGTDSGEIIVMRFDFSRGRPWEDMTSRSAPHPRAVKLMPEMPEGDVAPARMTEHRTPWAALKRLFKSSSRNDGEQ